MSVVPGGVVWQEQRQLCRRRVDCVDPSVNGRVHAENDCLRVGRNLAEVLTVVRRSSRDQRGTSNLGYSAVMLAYDLVPACNSCCWVCEFLPVPA